ncbi:MAG: HupE/UreJ family protein [Bryobacterales bacterium]|nr:HupE/UreJ family protein [Bryobacterales bacterium]
MAPTAVLFIMCLVIPFRRITALAGIVTSFTAAHSITLISAAYGLGPEALWFPPLIETLIAASIVWMALENNAGGITCAGKFPILRHNQTKEALRGARAVRISRAAGGLGRSG